MAVQETTNVAAIATRACSPGHLEDPLYGSVLEVKTSASDEEFDVVVRNKKHKQGSGKQELKENIQVNPNKPLKLTTGKHDEAHKKMTRKINKESTDDLLDIYISDEVLKQLRSQTEDKEKKQSRQVRRKQAKSQRKIVKSGLNNKEETDAIIRGQSKRIPKPSLRRKSSLSVGKSQFIEHEQEMELLTNSEENDGNKAENNNWMVDDEITTNMHNNLVVQHIYSSRNSTFLDNIIQPSDSMCVVSSSKKCTLQKCESAKGLEDSVTNKEFQRADSSDDSGCFSNVSVQSISSPSGDRQAVSFEEYTSRSSDESRAASATTQVSNSSSGLCSACRHEPQGHGSGLCKTCIGRIKHDGIRIGALGELRAYAQSIADSVKKILSISPRQSEEVLHASTSTESKEEGKSCESKAEITNIHGAQLQKCKTQIAMTHSENVRTMNLLNKSVSFDGRAAAHLEDNARGSPVYWISQNKPHLPISSSTLSEIDENKPFSTLENSSEHSVIDGDYFPWSGKEIKPYGGHDGGDGSSVAERARRKIYLKQLSCVERMRPEGDTRSSYSQRMASDRKLAPRRKSQISHTVNIEEENVGKSSQKHDEEIKALNVFRLKVIHEGSPVDPLYTVQPGKGEDYKDKRAILTRSATAPNKNLMPKKDGSMEDKSGVTRSSARARRVNTRLDMKTNKSSPLQTDGIVLEVVQEKKQSTYEAQLESWRDDTSVMAVTPFTRRRSTSYDGRRAVSSKRNERHRSISRPAVEREDKGKIQRRHATLAEKASAKMNTENVGEYISKNEQKLRIANRSTDYNRRATRSHSSPKVGAFTDTYRYHALESSNNLTNDRIFSVPIDEEHLGLLESSSKSYFNDDKYYCHQAENQLSVVPHEQIHNAQNASSLGTESYYCHIDQFDSNSQLVSENDFKFESEERNSMFKGVDDEDPYHKQIQVYSGDDISYGKESPWYSPQREKRALFARDRSHESKSSTSFHIVNPARSSHSDVALMKHQSSWEHATSRRQTMYSETDVDTGLIYHFAKRQTTRAHIPTYHDFTSASKDIYTMSGDVSTSASSNSSISSKSEVSDSVYTGGFFQHDPFYDNDNRVSSSCSTHSPAHLYFEPSKATKREPSELDIYTGALFSSSQNALSLGRATEDVKNPSLHAHKNGSSNNSTRPPLSRVSRRIRNKPHIDVITFKMAEWELFSKSFQQNSEIIVTNISNNSSSWSEAEDLKDSIYQGALIKESKEPSYTEYESAKTPAFHVKTFEKTAPVLNMMRYDKPMASTSSFFYTAPSPTNVGGDSIWYSGLSDNMMEESNLRQVALPEQAAAHTSYSWQRNDDYYTSTQRPMFNKTNNYSSCEESEQPFSNTNNNSFEDIYTGFFEAANPKTCIPDQVSNCRKASVDNWYSEQPKQNYSSSNFYHEDLTLSETPKRASTASEGAYSSASVFGQASEAYSGSGSYMNQTGWREYDKIDKSSSNSYVDESPKFRHPTPEPLSMSEKCSYFQYIANESPSEATYRYDKGAYGFDQRTPSPEIDINEIRKVGGIVCRENVVNKEDYAEDVNRDLEQGGWMPFNFRHEEKTRHQDDINTGRPEVFSEILKAPVVVNNDKQFRHSDESSYNQDRIYNDVGARNKWREMKTKGQPNVTKKRDSSPRKAHSTGDTKKQDHIKTGAWNPPDQIPDRARGKRPTTSTPKPTVVEGSKGGTTSTSNVISSVTSIPSRLTNYVRRWF